MSERCLLTKELSIALAAGLRHVGIVNNHTGGIFGVPDVRTYGNVGGKFLVDIAENVAPVDSLIGKNAIEYVLMAAKEGLKRTANIVRCLSVMFLVPRTFISPDFSATQISRPQGCIAFPAQSGNQSLQEAYISLFLSRCI